MASLPSSSSTRSILRWLDRWILGRDARAPVVRFVLVWGSFGLFWLLLVFYSGLQLPALPAWLEWLPFPFDAVAQTGSMFFTPPVLVHLLPVAFGLWLGFRVAALYLSDLYELDNPATAARYLWPALFGLDPVSYPRLDVRAGDLEQIEADHPLVVIGGPGYVRIHLGYAAVFEGIDGRPRVYGPTPLQFIHGFERLRDVVDLRDQAAKVDLVHARTQDGIEVCAREAQMVFRVYRGRGRRRTLENPYPFDEASVRRLVYAQPVDESGRARWKEALPDRVRREIQRFVSELTLEEFLALRPQASPGQERHAFHIPRHALTARFHTPQAVERLKEAGLELDWVGVGTWEVHDRPSRADDGGVGQALISGWREKERLALYTSPKYLERQQARGYRDYVAGLLTEWIDAWEGEDGQDSQAACLQLLSRIREQLTRMHEELQNDPHGRAPLGMEDALRHLTSLISSPWLDGGA